MTEAATNNQSAWRYEQLADTLAGHIAAGAWPAGRRLPSIRQLAASQRVSISTVQQALHLLEQRGLVEARPQSGFYVRAQCLAEPLRQHAPPVEAQAVAVSNEVVRVLSLGVQPDKVPLTAALPAPELLPLAALHRLYATVARQQSPLARGSNHVAVDEPALARELGRQSVHWGCPLDPGEFVITHSCTEAIALCLQAVTRPGDTVAVESPAYYLMLQLLEKMGLRALEIPCDPEQGVSVDALELAMRSAGVKAVLLVANGSNPLGSVMPDEAKARLAALAAQYEVPVIEDDIYGDLHFGRQRPRPIKAFDLAGWVMLCSSFSKSLSPALRIGFVAAGRWRGEIALRKAVGSGGTSPVTQLVLAAYLGSGAYQRHLHGLRREYQRQVDAMRLAVLRHFPAGTRIARPQAGLVLWIELPAGVDTSAAHAEAIAAGVGYVPGVLFSPSGLYRHCLRLNCGHPFSPAIEAAVATLGRLFRRLAEDAAAGA